MPGYDLLTIDQFDTMTVDQFDTLEIDSTASTLCSGGGLSVGIGIGL